MYVLFKSREYRFCFNEYSIDFDSIHWKRWTLVSPKKEQKNKQQKYLIADLFTLNLHLWSVTKVTFRLRCSSILRMWNGSKTIFMVKISQRTNYISLSIERSFIDALSNSKEYIKKYSHSFSERIHIVSGVVYARTRGKDTFTRFSLII